MRPSDGEATGEAGEEAAPPVQADWHVIEGGLFVADRDYAAATANGDPAAQRRAVLCAIEAAVMLVRQATPHLCHAVRPFLALQAAIQTIEKGETASLFSLEAPKRRDWEARVRTAHGAAIADALHQFGGMQKKLAEEKVAKTLGQSRKSFHDWCKEFRRGKPSGGEDSVRRFKENSEAYWVVRRGIVALIEARLGTRDTYSLSPHEKSGVIDFLQNEILPVI